MWQELINLSNAISVACALMATFTTISARYHLKHLRFEMTKQFNSLTHDLETRSPVVPTVKERIAKSRVTRLAGNGPGQSSAGNQP